MSILNERMGAWLRPAALAGCLAAASPASAQFGVITDRPELDGAGPTNIFALSGTHVAIVDPLLGAVHAYRIAPTDDAATASATRTGSCSIPHDFRPWRLVRRGSVVTIVDEQERWSIDVPRRAGLGRDRGCRIPRRVYRRSTDAGPQFKRIDASELRVANGKAAPIVLRQEGGAIYSAQELERQGPFRSFLVKQAAPGMEALGKTASIGVDVVVWRFDARGRPVAQRRLPDQSGWTKRAFDYATMLSGGRVMYLHHKSGEDFRFTLMPLEPLQGAGIATPVNRRAHPPVKAGAEPRRISLAVKRITGAATAFVSAVGSRLRPSAQASWPLPVEGRVDGRSMIEAAESFLRVSPAWKLPSLDMSKVAVAGPGEHWVCVEGKRQRWVQPLQFRRPAPGVAYTAVPYSFGGNDDPTSFLSRATSERLIGHIGDTLDEDKLPCEPGDIEVAYPLPGVDCSKLVWHAWGRPRPVGRADTRSTWHMLNGQTFPGMCPKLVPSHRDLQPGDVIARPGHVVIFSSFVTGPDGASTMLEVIEAASRCSSVCRSRYELDYLHGWRIYRRQGRSDGVPCP